jgi:BirA family biotin operon repressor/biotin-[acetyl-CoA-carboxylase] ligase
MDAETIISVLQTRVIGREILCLDTVDSTNRYARELAEHGAAEGVVVLAEEQTRGRGRLDRTWHSPPGLGLWFSLILRPPIAPAAAPGLSLLTGLAVAKAIESQLHITADLKWPNDCLLYDKKTAGILIDLAAEAKSVRFIVVGIGINVRLLTDDFPPELRETATSLAVAAGHSVDRETILAAVLTEFETDYFRFLAEGLTPTIGPYTRRCGLIGCQVDILAGRKTIRGTAVRIDPSGALVLVANGQEHVLMAGEVTRVRKTGTI